MSRALFSERLAAGLARVGHVGRSARVDNAFYAPLPSLAAESRGKATATQSAGAADRVVRSTATSNVTLPVYADWIGGLLVSWLNRSQLEAFSAQYLPPSQEVTAPSEEADAAVSAAAVELAAVRRERHTAVSALEAALAEKTSAAAAEALALRAEVKTAEAAAADARIALNALREQAKARAGMSEREVEAIVSETRRHAVAEASAASRDEIDRHARAAADAVARAEAAEIAAAAAGGGLASTGAIAVTHPTFGALLHDFGYKRVYAMPVANLVSKDKVAVYDQQRAFRAERAEVIAKEKAKETAFSIPGVISIAEGLVPVKGPGKKGAKKKSGERTVSILDGQHRVGALDILLGKSVLSRDDRVLVEVFPDVDEQKATDLFMEINQAQPIRFVDLPGVTTPDMKWMLEGAVQRLKAEWPAMFSDSARCKQPNVNLDNLREELFNAEVTSRFNIATEEDFVTWLKATNQRLAERSDEQWLEARPKRGRGSGGSVATYMKALSKARDNNFFLGMDFMWLDADDDEVSK